MNKTKQVKILSFTYSKPTVEEKITLKDCRQEVADLISSGFSLISAIPYSTPNGLGVIDYILVKETELTPQEEDKEITK